MSTRRSNLAPWPGSVSTHEPMVEKVEPILCRYKKNLDPKECSNEFVILFWLHENFDSYACLIRESILYGFSNFRWNKFIHLAQNALHWHTRQMIQTLSIIHVNNSIVGINIYRGCGGSWHVLDVMFSSFDFHGLGITSMFIVWKHIHILCDSIRYTRCQHYHCRADR